MFKIVYGIGLIMIFIIRLPYWWLARGTRVVVDRKTVRERVLLALLSVGISVFPLVYVFTSWLSFADYWLPSWMGWMGAAVFALGLWRLWRAGAILVGFGPIAGGTPRSSRTGIYRHIRHPMYAFGWLLGIAQALLLWNWLVAGLASFALIYFQRVPREERIMLDCFGAYMRRSGRVIPRLSK